MRTFLISEPIKIIEALPSGKELIIESIPIGIKQENLPDRVLQGACSYDQILNELLKEDGLI